MAKRPNPSIPDDLYERVDEMRVAEGFGGGINQYIVKILREHVTKRDLSSELKGEMEAYVRECIDEGFGRLLSSGHFKEVVRALVDEIIKEEGDSGSE